jgi:hypothetical protein
MRFIFFLFLLSELSYAQEYENEYFSKRIFVEKMNIKSAQVSQLKKDSVWFDSHNYCFDDFGNLIKERTLGINHSKTYIYDSTNVLIEKIDSTNKNIKGRHKVLNIYNLNNQIIKQFFYFKLDNKKINKNIIINNSIIPDSIVGVFEIVENQYDINSNIENKKTIYYIYDIIDTVCINYKYNSKNKLILENNGNKKIKYLYNRKGHIKKIEHYYNSNKMIFEYSTLKYNSEGFLCKRKDFSTNKLHKTDIYNYDKNNLLISELIKYPTRKSIFRKYYYTFHNKK